MDLQVNQEAESFLQVAVEIREISANIGKPERLAYTKCPRYQPRSLER